jgi:hypothetical protein
MQTKSLVLIIVSTLTPLIALAQTTEFNWGENGYVNYSGGGLFENVSESCFDIYVTGLVNDHYEQDYLATGINDFNIDSVVHEYYFEFSEPTTVSLRIFEITSNTHIGTGGNHYDQLTFSPTPQFVFISDVVVYDSIVHPDTNMNLPLGEIEIFYNDISSFTIRHGGGVYNPGWIGLEEFKFSSSEICPNDIALNPNVTSGATTIVGKIDIFQYLDIYDSSGSLIETINQDILLTRNLDFSEYANGMYFCHFIGSAKPALIKLCITK